MNETYASGNFYGIGEEKKCHFFFPAGWCFGHYKLLRRNRSGGNGKKDEREEIGDMKDERFIFEEERREREGWVEIGLLRWPPAYNVRPSFLYAIKAEK